MNPLDQLPPVRLPEAISWWPLAIGWWLVIVMSLLAIIILTVYLCRRYRANLLKRATLAEAQQLYQQFLLNKNCHNYLIQYNQLLRRFCVQQFPDINCASLSGELWLKQLDTLAEQPLFQSDAGRQLLIIYQPNHEENIDIAALDSLIKQWLAKVRTQKNKREASVSL